MKPIKNPTTPQHKEEFAGYVKKWQGILGMQDWRVVVSKTAADKRSMAMVRRSYPDRLATVYFGEDFGSEEITPQSLEETAVHELLHVFLCELIWCVGKEEPSDDDVMSAEHRIINVLSALLTNR